MSLSYKVLFAFLLTFSIVSISLNSYANDAYDPFIDYSEFDDNGDEEADINFFKNGRLFSLGFIGGYSGLTGTLGEIYEPAVTYGLSLNFFFDLRFALQLQYILANHNLLFDAAGEKVKGSSNFNDISLNLKYFINTQNIIRDLAVFNPYVIIGFSHVTRETAIASDPLFDKTTGMGANIGGGVEYQLSNKKFYIGFEAIYNLVSLKDEGSELTPNGTSTNIFPSGDIYRFVGTLGVNF